MEPREAYMILTKHLKERVVVKICHEYENCYAFRVADPRTKPNQNAFVGGELLIVDKKTKKVYEEYDYGEKGDLITRFVSLSNFN